MKNFSLDSENPKSIYDFVHHQVLELSDKIDKLKQSNLNTNNANLEDEKIHQILNGLQNNISTTIKQLETNAEWNTFQIAFFGETNAGKSTIIETLRILLNEPSKVEQQNKFIETTNRLGISAEKFYQMQNELDELNKIFNQFNAQKILVEQKYANQLNDIIGQEQQICQKWDNQIAEIANPYQSNLQEKQRKIELLKRKIKRIKADMNWFLKIIYMFIKLDEQKELLSLENELEDLQYEMDGAIAKLQRQKAIEVTPITNQKQETLKEIQKEIEPIEIQRQSYEPQYQSLQQWFSEFDNKKKQLLPHLDGQIMGDGRSDFTRESTTHQFQINNYPVNMIDVPGIEGNEKIVQNEITKAVQKTHAVFYVTSKDAPPNEGTLERIKSYLNDQTEVWAIYNKQITNPRQLNKELIHSDDEKQSLNDLELKLKEILGNHYCGLIALAGLPAFFSQATCIEPFSIMYEQQNKFLDKLGKDGLSQLSQLQSLEHKLKHTIVGDVTNKIKKSNFNKVKVLLDDSCISLNEIYNTYNHYEQDLRTKIAIANQSINGYFSDFEMTIRGQADSIVSNWQRSCRSIMYDYINKDVSNDDFKYKFDRVLNSESSALETELKQMIETHAKELEKNISKIQKELIHQVNELSSEYGQYSQFNNDNITLNFNLDNGINKMGMVGALISGAILFWNPAGWAIMAVSAVGLIISFAKAIWGFFSSSYKMEQQRKNVDNNLPKVARQISEEIGNSLHNLSDHLATSKNEIILKLNSISEPITQLNQDLTYSIKSLQEISNQISSN